MTLQDQILDLKGKLKATEMLAEEFKDLYKSKQEQAFRFANRLVDEKAMAKDLADVVRHALDLGHLGEGSTHGWATQVLAQFDLKNR